MSEISLHCLLSDTKTLLKKKGTYITMEVPQQVNTFQNVLNPSLLFNSFVQISSESYPPKEFEGKRKGKSGKDETSRIILQVNSIFWGKK